MNIRDKLLFDKKKLSVDIDFAIEKLDEYAKTIDKLATQVEIAKKAFEDFVEEYNSADYPISDEFAKKALNEMEKITESE